MSLFLTRRQSGRATQLSLGVGVRMTRSVEIAKAMAVAGFDWLFLDMEHGVMSLEACAQISIAALDAGIAPIARVPNGEYAIAPRALDNGALGIVMIPRSCAACGDGHRPHPVLGRLPVRRKPARHRMAEDAAARPRRHREAAERQRPAACSSSERGGRPQQGLRPYAIPD
jgi:hypothetical protein